MTGMDKHDPLKACPFCGRAEFVRLAPFEGNCINCGYGEWGRIVVCAANPRCGAHGCGANTGYCESDADAITIWNTRA